MKSTLPLFLAAALLVPALAHADDITQRKSLIGVDFDLLPSGSVTANFAGSGDTTSDLKTAYGIAGDFETEIAPHVSIGLAPRYVLALNAANSNGDSSTELDLRARVTVGGQVIPKLRVYGYAAPGYGIIFPPDSVQVNNNKVHPNGFIIAAGGGVTYAIAPDVRLLVELGYQWGFESWSASGTVLGQTVTVSGDDKVNLLQLGFGLQFAID
jgi:hypothetical protein